MELSLPKLLLVLLLITGETLAAGACPPGYGLNWQGQCLDCSQTSNAMVCAGTGGSSAESSAGDAKVQQAVQILNAVDAIGTYLDEHGNKATQGDTEVEKSDLQLQIEESDRIMAARRKAELQTVDSLESSMADMQDSDWRSRAQSTDKASTDKTKSGRRNSDAVECNCRKSVGSCTATIELLKKQKTGFDYRVSSSEQQCSKVSYYIDNTPYISVLANRNSTLEHTSGMANISAKSFEIERCDVCERQ